MRQFPISMRFHSLVVWCALLAVALLSTAFITLQHNSPMPPESGDSPLGSSTVVSLILGVVGCLGLAWQRRGNAVEVAICLFFAGVLLILAVGEETESFVRIGQFWDDDYRYKLPFWVAGGVGIYALRRATNVPWSAMRLFEIGFAIQTLSNFFDMSDGDLFLLSSIAQFPFDLSETSELVFAQIYVAGFIVLFLHRGRWIRPAFAGPVGTRARAIFDYYGLFKSANYPPYRLAHYPIVRGIVLVGAIAWLVWRIGPTIYRAVGYPIHRQILDMLRLGFWERIDPVTYYLQDFYRAERRKEAPHYLTRYETKNGLVSALNHMKPQPYDRSELTDKLLFANCCERSGVSSVPTFLVIEKGGVEWRVTDRSKLERDLFVKPRKGKGARSTATLSYRGQGRYWSDPIGEVRLDEALRRLCVQHQGSWLVQPRLRNHPSVADLASDSLVVIRVITCLNEFDVPEVTYGMFRVLGKLEPTWPTTEEFGAPIDLETGELGLLTGDNPYNCLQRYTAHPVTKAPVLGRNIDSWQEVHDLAVDAHSAFLNRVLIGWDIAITDEGPLVLEGNNVLDVAFPQRTHAAAMGKGRSGELLQLQLGALCRHLEQSERHRRSF